MNPWQSGGRCSSRTGLDGGMDGGTDGGMMDTSMGERFARALAAKDASTLRQLLAPDIDFRALTPGRFWEATTRAEVVDSVFFGNWFAPSDHIEAVERIEHDVV